MLSKLTVGSTDLGIWIAKDQQDIQEAEAAYLPYVVWPHEDLLLLQLVMYKHIKKIVPGLKLQNEYKLKNCQSTIKQLIVANEHCEQHSGEFNESKRYIDSVKRSSTMSGAKRTYHIDGNKYKGIGEHISLADYVDGQSIEVNIEVLRELNMLPPFMSDLMDSIERRYDNYTYVDGYNKKLGAAIGTWDGVSPKSNLIILDVSASIPQGISATMLTLIDTLRTQLDAELIITGATSYYFGKNDVLPTPQELRNKIAPSNEASMFIGILRNHIFNREWGHIYSFGDCDTPAYGKYDIGYTNTTVEYVHHFHTYKPLKTGYATWTELEGVCSAKKVEISTSWVDWIDPYYSMDEESDNGL